MLAVMTVKHARNQIVTIILFVCTVSGIAVVNNHVCDFVVALHYVSSQHVSLFIAGHIRSPQFIQSHESSRIKTTIQYHETSILIKMLLFRDRLNFYDVFNLLRNIKTHNLLMYSAINFNVSSLNTTVEFWRRCRVSVAKALFESKQCDVLQGYASMNMQKKITIGEGGKYFKM